jgi:formiminotetrahydrofolate cyclodeaminase
MLIDKPVSELLRAFASSDPTPGGGSASALAGAVGASLLLMVSGLPKTRNGTEEDRRALDAARSRLEPLGAELATLVDRDTAAYDRVVGAYRLPKNTEAEKGQRKEAIQSALQGAIETPLAMLRAIAAAAADAAVVARHGSASAGSDVIVAAELLGAAAHGALANVEINLGSLADKTRAAALRDEAGRLVDKATADAASAREAAGIQGQRT